MHVCIHKEPETDCINCCLDFIINYQQYLSITIPWLVELTFPFDQGQRLYLYTVQVDTLIGIAAIIFSASICSSNIYKISSGRGSREWVTLVS